MKDMSKEYGGITKMTRLNAMCARLGQVSECLECGRNFNSQRLLQLHMKVTHKSEYIVECKICDEKFHDDRAHKEHYDKYHTLRVCKNSTRLDIAKGLYGMIEYV